MGQAAVKIKIMPESLDSNLKEIEDRAKEIISNHHGKIARVDIEPIAFGLEALILTFSIEETFDQDSLEKELKEIKNTASCEIIDFRRISF